MGNYRKANYRTRDGKRLTAAEYKKRRKMEIIFHLSAFVVVFVLAFAGIYVGYALLKKHFEKIDIRVAA